MTETTDATENTEESKNVIDLSDDELKAIAFPMFDNLIKYSNEGQYGMFIKNFFSMFKSGAQRLPNGNTLIVESNWGRIFEVQQKGDIV